MAGLMPQRGSRMIIQTIKSLMRLPEGPDVTLRAAILCGVHVFIYRV